MLDQPSQDGVLSLHFPLLHVIFEAPTRAYDELLHPNVTTLPLAKLFPTCQPFLGFPGALHFAVKNSSKLILAIQNEISIYSTTRKRFDILH